MCEDIYATLSFGSMAEVCIILQNSAIGKMAFLCKRKGCSANDASSEAPQQQWQAVVAAALGCFLLLLQMEAINQHLRLKMNKLAEAQT